MKSTQTNLDCINILKGLSYSQMFLQDQRAAILNSGYFNDDDAFTQIDRKNVGKIFTNDLIQYLSVHRIASTQRQCQYLIWNAGSQQSFLSYQQFKLYLANGQINMVNRLANSVLSRNMNSADQIMKSTSQREMATILQKEIQYYRTIEALKEEFIKKYGYNFKNVVASIDREKRGNVSFDSLIRFIHQHGVEFSIEEFQGLCRKIKSKQNDVISFKEMLRALSPFQPLNFPTYRKQSNIQKAMEYINDQVQRLKIQVHPSSFDQNPSHVAKTSTGFQKVVQNLRSTSKNATHNKYFYDKNYYNQLRQYKASYFDPNKRKYKSSEMTGPQYHDHFFSDYYMYLEERNKTEHYYNKFGKRYTFENSINKVIQGGN